MKFFAQYLPWIVVGLATLFLAIAMMPPAEDSKHEQLYEFGTIPVQDNGRVKPIDTVARYQLLFVNHKQSFVDTEDHSQLAVKWLLDVMVSKRESGSQAENYKVFRIEDSQLLGLIGLEERPGFRYSLAEIREHNGTKLAKEFFRALQAQKQGAKLSRYDQRIVDLGRQIQTYESLADQKDLHLVPSGSVSDEWQDLSLSRAMPEALHKNMPTKYAKQLNELLGSYQRGDAPAFSRAADEYLESYEKEHRGESADPRYVLDFYKILEAHRTGDAEAFNKAVADYHATFAREYPDEARKARFEAFFNHAEPFYQCMVLYVCVFLLVCFGWLGIPLPLNRSAFWLTILTLAVHIFGLLGRMYITERPFVFVTNLYSSAVFIGAMSVALGLILERLYPLGIGNCVAAVGGFITLYIAHTLAASGDTIEVMQAVLDTNFWLATHVTMVTLGYAATFVAGALGLVFVIFQLFMVVRRFLDGARDIPTKVITFTLGLPIFVILQLAQAIRPLLHETDLAIPSNGSELTQQFRLDQDMIRIFGRAIYGIVCFATFLSFVGTVLGGIWADQSWGRFWGWDPKENGALIIVIWNALILHARWCGLVQSRGMAALALGGNIVTSWSWFGVNMLGVGLHSYGFMEGAVFWLLTWIGFNLVMAGVCLMPSYLWRDEARPKKPPEPMPIRQDKSRKGKKHARRDAITTASPIYR